MPFIFNRRGAIERHIKTADEIAAFAASEGLTVDTIELEPGSPCSGGGIHARFRFTGGSHAMVHFFNRLELYGFLRRWKALWPTVIESRPESLHDKVVAECDIPATYVLGGQWDGGSCSVG